jgi:hypothetical protein
MASKRPAPDKRPPPKKQTLLAPIYPRIVQIKEVVPQPHQLVSAATRAAVERQRLDPASYLAVLPSDMFRYYFFERYLAVSLSYTSATRSFAAPEKVRPSPPPRSTVVFRSPPEAVRERPPAKVSRFALTRLVYLGKLNDTLYFARIFSGVRECYPGVHVIALSRLGVPQLIKLNSIDYIDAFTEASVAKIYMVNHAVYDEPVFTVVSERFPAGCHGRHVKHFCTMDYTLGGRLLQAQVVDVSEARPFTFEQGVVRYSPRKDTRGFPIAYIGRVDRKSGEIGQFCRLHTARSQTFEQTRLLDRDDSHAEAQKSYFPIGDGHYLAVDATLFYSGPIHLDWGDETVFSDNGALAVALAYHPKGNKRAIQVYRSHDAALMGSPHYIDDRASKAIAAFFDDGSLGIFWTGKNDWIGTEVLGAANNGFAAGKYSGDWA